ncbi:hypothetical protein ACX3SV_11685 [Hafnia paralvei]
MAQNFSTLEEMGSRFGVDADVCIQAWIDILRARYATGLLRRSRNNAVS